MKRELAAPLTPPRRRVRAADIMITSPASRTVKEPGIIRCGVREYCRNGSDASRYFPSEHTVWQFQLQHEEKPSVTFKILQHFVTFMNERAAELDAEPYTDLEAIESREKIRVLITPDQLSSECSSEFVLNSKEDEYKRKRRILSINGSA